MKNKRKQKIEFISNVVLKKLSPGCPDWTLDEGFCGHVYSAEIGKNKVDFFDHFNHFVINEKRIKLNNFSEEVKDKIEVIGMMLECRKIAEEEIFISEGKNKVERKIRRKIVDIKNKIRKRKWNYFRIPIFAELPKSVSENYDRDINEYESQLKILENLIK